MALAGGQLTEKGIKVSEKPPSEVVFLVCPLPLLACSCNCLTSAATTTTKSGRTVQEKTRLVPPDSQAGKAVSCKGVSVLASETAIFPPERCFTKSRSGKAFMGQIQKSIKRELLLFILKLI